MESLQQFIEGVGRLIGKTISIDEVGYESLQFENEEIDETLIPTEILVPLPEPIVTTSIDYTDAGGINICIYLCLVMRLDYHRMKCG